MFSLGVGLFANNNPVLNNTAILADKNNQIGVIYCNSGSKLAGIGQWFSPSGAEITQNSGGTFTVVRGGGNIPSYIGLQLRAGRSFSTSDEGIYTCLIPDENDVEQALQIGIYHDGYIGEYLMWLSQLVSGTHCESQHATEIYFDAIIIRKWA